MYRPRPRPRTRIKFKFYLFKQGQAFYTVKDMNEFHPIVYGEDIVATDADEDSARYKAMLFASCWPGL